MMGTWQVVFKKEIKDMVRDRRAVIAILYYAFGVPLLMAFIMYLMQDSRDKNDLVHLAMAGAADAPGLVAFMNKQGIEVTDVARTDDVPAALPAGMDALVILPEDYTDLMKAGRPVPIRLYVDETTKGGAKRGHQVERAIGAYSGQLAGARLITRGVPLALMTPYAIETNDLARRQFMYKMLGYSLVLLFMFAPFVSGMSVALDAFAGERERQSLQSLMAQPVSVRDVVIGKWLTVALFCFTGTALSLTVNLTMLSLVPAEVLPFAMQASAGGIVIAYAQMAALCLFVASLLLAVSIHAKSFKEGQTYMSLFMLLPLLIGYIKMYGDAKLPAVANYLPIFADIESMSSILFVGVPEPVFIGVALLANFVGAAIALTITARRLAGEQILADA